MAVADKAIFELKGFNELHAKITKLKDSVKKREMLKILRVTSEATVKAARLAAPKSKKPHLISGKRKRKIVQPGNLKRSIGKIVGKKGSAKVNAVLYVGPRAQPSYRGKHDGWYGGMVHGGHEIVNKKTTRSQRKNAKRRGFGVLAKVEPNPFMDKAFAITKGKVSSDAEQKVAAFLQKQINRLSQSGV